MERILSTEVWLAIAVMSCAERCGPGHGYTPYHRSVKGVPSRPKYHSKSSSQKKLRSSVIGATGLVIVTKALRIWLPKDLTNITKQHVSGSPFATISGRMVHRRSLRIRKKWVSAVVVYTSADRKRRQRKGATSKNVKNRQKVSKIVSTFFAQGKKRQKSSKISVKNDFDTFRQFSRGTTFPAPFGGLWIDSSCFFPAGTLIPSMGDCAGQSSPSLSMSTQARARLVLTWYDQKPLVCHTTLMLPSRSMREEMPLPIATPLWVLTNRGESGSCQRGRCRRGRSEIPHFSSKLQLLAPCSRIKRQ